MRKPLTFCFAAVMVMTSASSLAWRIEIPGLGEAKGDDPQLPKLPPTLDPGKLAGAVINDPVKLIVNPTSFINPTGIPTPGDFMEFVIKNPDKAIELVQNPGDWPYTPVATAMISARNAVVANGGQPIPSQTKAFLRRWYSDDLINSIRWTSDWDLLQNFIANAQMNFNPKTGAITFINAVVFRDNRAASDLSTWAHELYHAEQYRKWGVFGFAKAWVDNSSNGGPVESPAYARGREADQILAAQQVQPAYGGASVLGEQAATTGPGPAPGPITGPGPGPGLPSGYALSGCGCWGYVNPQAFRPEQMCRSSIAVPAMCPGICSMGGAPWMTVCR